MKDKIYYIIAGIALIENTVAMMALGGIWIIVGLLFGGFWLLLAIDDWHRYHRLKVDLEQMPESQRRLIEVGVRRRYAGESDVIGDATCKLNARSPELRCAVNPSGPCEGCKFYESKNQN